MRLSVLLVSRWSQSLYKGCNGTGRHWLSFSQYSTTPGNSLSLGDVSPPGSTTGDSPVLERTLVSCHSFDAELVPLHLHRAVRVVSQGKLRLVSQPKLWVVSQPKLWEWFHSPNCEAGFTAQTVRVVSQPKLWPCTVLTLGDIQIQEVTNLPCIVIVWKCCPRRWMTRVMGIMYHTFKVMKSFLGACTQESTCWHKLSEGVSPCIVWHTHICQSQKLVVVKDFDWNKEGVNACCNLF